MVPFLHTSGRAVSAGPEAPAKRASEKQNRQKRREEGAVNVAELSNNTMEDVVVPGGLGDPTRPYPDCTTVGGDAVKLEIVQEGMAEMIEGKHTSRCAGIGEE